MICHRYWLTASSSYLTKGGESSPLGEGKTVGKKRGKTALSLGRGWRKAPGEGSYRSWRYLRKPGLIGHSLDVLGARLK